MAAKGRWRRWSRQRVGKSFDEKVVGPLGSKVTASFGILGKSRTAIIEMAEASGLKLVSQKKCNPLVTTTYGTGELIHAAIDLGCTKIIVGIGGSATNDAGAGMAQALGWRLLDENGKQIGFGGGALRNLACIKSPFPHSPIQVLVACDVTNPLYGKNGAANIYGPQKGATSAMVSELDLGLRHFAKIVKRDLKKDVAHFSGSGAAAGGLGAGLVAFCDAELRSGVELVLEAIRFDEILRGADLVITGEGRIDEQTAAGKAPWGVAGCARKRGIPVIAFGGSVPLYPSRKLRKQFDAMVPIARRRVSLRYSMQHAGRLLEDSIAETMKRFL